MIKNGTKIKFKPDYDDGSGEVFTVSQWDGSKGWAGDAQGRGYSFRLYQVYEVRDTPNECLHLNVMITWRLWRAETREEPAEYEGRARCKDCGATFDPEDVDECADVEDEYE